MDPENTSFSSTFPGATTGELDAPRTWSPIAPQNVTQSILPSIFATNSTLFITDANSSCPETEQKILAKESYGRQLGRVIDALEVLIQERPKGAAKSKALTEFLALSHNIESIKDESLAAHIKRLEAELVWLEKNNPGEYRRIASKFSVQAKTKP